MSIQYSTRSETLTTQRQWPAWAVKLMRRLLALPEGTHCITIEPTADGQRRWRVDSVGKWENDK